MAATKSTLFPCQSVAPLLVFSMLFSPVVVSKPPESAVLGCADELVLLSPCLFFISAPPNNISDKESSDCCDAFSLLYNSSGGICLCYVLQRPEIFGFPLNKTKLLSLPSDCLSNETRSAGNSSVELLCSDSPALPPLRSISIPRGRGPPDCGTENLTSPSRGFEAEPARTPAALPSLSPKLPERSTPPRSSSAARARRNWYLIWGQPTLLSLLFSFY